MYKNIIAITIAALLAVTSQTFLKKGVKIIGELKIGSLHDLGVIISKLIQSKFIIIGVFIAAGSAFLWLTIISRLSLATALPIIGGIIYILSFLVSWILFGETIVLAQIIGAVVILIGVFIIIK